MSHYNLALCINSNLKYVLIKYDNEKYIIFRFVSWKALHDLGQSGFTLRQKFSLISKLNNL